MRTFFRFVGIIAGYFFCQSMAFAEFPRIEPAVGLGINSLDMEVKTDGGSAENGQNGSIQETIKYSTTNNSFYFVNLGIGRFSIQGKFPYSDSKETHLEKGNTKTSDYQLGLAVTPQIQVELYFQKYDGYYLEVADRKMIHPDLSFGHTGGQVFYILNPTFTPAMYRDASWEQSQTAGSWMLSMGYDHFAIHGDLVPPALQTNMKSNLKEANIESLSLRGLYGHNWVWKNWFAGGAIGLGTTLSQIRYSYRDSGSEEQKSEINSSVGASAGYKWASSKVGFFTRVHSWGLAFDDKEISTSASATGIYWSSYF